MTRKPRRPRPPRVVSHVQAATIAAWVATAVTALAAWIVIDLDWSVLLFQLSLVTAAALWLAAVVLRLARNLAQYVHHCHKTNADNVSLLRKDMRTEHDKIHDELRRMHSVIRREGIIEAELQQFLRPREN